MNEAKHTPGPWLYHPPSFIGTDEEDPQTIGYVSDHRNRKARPSGEMEANGHLFAAAPDLLAALEEMLKELPAYHHTDERHYVRCRAYAALAKAKGGA